MLLKIFTCQNSIKIIDKIDDAEIHQGEYKVDNYAQLYDSIQYGPGVNRITGTNPPTESFDYDMNLPYMEASDLKTSSNVVKYVDYLKNNEWRRVAIQQYAYLCNDDGKTIAKVGA